MSTSTTSPNDPGKFPGTRWTVVLAAGGTPSAESTVALERLCQSYWYPLYAYVRRRGHSPPDAEDLTQEFFARLLEHNWIARADRHKGRFRSFLLMAMKRFLAKEWDKVKTIKRGGQTRLVPLQLDTAESRYTREPADTRTPEQVFEKQWALMLLESVLKRLRGHYASCSKATRSSSPRRNNSALSQVNCSCGTAGANSSSTSANSRSHGPGRSLSFRWRRFVTSASAIAVE